MPVQMKITDTRTFECPVPATTQDTETLGIALKQAGEEGFLLASAMTIEGGSQRDPFMVGLRIVVAKP